MENLLGRLGLGMTIMTTDEHMQQLNKADILVVDEIDETILDTPYVVKSNTDS